MASNPLLPSGTHTHKVQDIRNYNLNSGVAPLPTDGDNLGYSNGSIWIDTSALPQPQAYICVDATFPNAVWEPLNADVQVPINRTLFVDSQFGTPAGVPQDLTKPFDTLANALAAATSAGDVIYVQPGTYPVTAPLVLQDGVDWYFSEGANVLSSSATSVFDDSNGAVECSISGFGVFTVLSGSNNVLLTRNASSVSFFARSIDSQSTATTALFDLACTTPGGASRYTIDIETATQIVTPPIVIPLSIITIGSVGSTGSTIDVQYEGQSIAGVGVVHALSGQGMCDLAVQSIVCGSSSVDGNEEERGALFFNSTDSYAIRVAAQAIDSTSATHAILIRNQNAAPATPRITVNAQSITVAGGLAYVHGFDNTAAIEEQPHLEVAAAEIFVGGTPTANLFPVYSLHGWLVMRATTYVNERADIEYNFSVRDKARMFVDVRRMLLTASKAFDVYNVTPSTDITTLVVDAGDISAIDSLLRVDNECRVTMVARQLICNTAIVGQSAIFTQGLVTQPPPISALLATTTITTDLLWLSATGTDGTDAGRASMINHTAGMLYLTVNTYGVDGAFYNAIRIGPGLNVNQVNVNLCGIIAAESRFLFLEGGPNVGEPTACVIKSETIACGLLDGGAGTVAIDLYHGQLNGEIGSIVILGDAASNGVLLRGSSNDVGGSQYTVRTFAIQVLQFGATPTDTIGLNVQGDSSVLAEIDVIASSGGSIIRSTSSQNVQILFQNLSANTAARPLEFLGTGDARLTGGEINSGDTATDVVYATNNAEISLTLQRVNCQTAETIFRIENSASLYLTFQQIYGNNISVAGILANAANGVQVNGENFGLSSNGPAYPDIISATSQNNFVFTCQQVNANNRINAFVRATGVLLPSPTSSTVQIQISTFYSSELVNALYVDNGSRVQLTFQYMNLNSLTGDGFVAVGNNVNIHMQGLLLQTSADEDTDVHIFALTGGNPYVVANIDDINLGGNQNASLLYCETAGNFSLASQRVGLGQIDNILAITGANVTLAIDNLYVNLGSSETAVQVDSSTLRITGQQWTFGTLADQTLFEALNNATLDITLTELLTSSVCGHILHTNNNVRAFFNINVYDINGSATGAFLLEGQQETVIRADRMRINNNTAGAAFLTADSGRLTFAVQQIDLNVADSLLSLSGMNNTVVEWGDLSVPVRLTGVEITDSTVSITGRRTEISSGGSPTEAFRFFGNSVVTGDFGRTILGMPGFRTQDAAIVDLALQNLSTNGVGLAAEGTGAVTFLPSYAITGGNFPVVYITAPVDGGRITVGGYFDVQSSDHAIEYDTASAAANLSLMASKLISATESIFSPTTAVTVSAVPSSARVDVNANVTIIPNVPNSVLFIDAALF